MHNLAWHMLDLNGRLLRLKACIAIAVLCADAPALAAKHVVLYSKQQAFRVMQQSGVQRGLQP